MAFDKAYGGHVQSKEKAHLGGAKLVRLSAWEK